MRVALLSDIHGNLVALERTLAAIEAAAVDRVVCLGDVAADGPQPRQVIAALRDLRCPVVLGNTDADLLQSVSVVPATADSQRFHEMERWARDQFSPADLGFLRTFQPTITVSLGADVTLLCFHGSPRSNTEVLEATTPDAALAPMLAGHHATVLAGGHTHMQMLRRYRDMLIVNPGSVGLPFEQADQVRNPAWAEYAIVTWDAGALGIELRRVPVDLLALGQAARASGMPHAEWWAGEWR